MLVVLFLWRGLRAACLRRLGRMKDAAGEIEAARAIDPQDPFLQIEQMRPGYKKAIVTLAPGGRIDSTRSW